jgi:hypothetical protein
MILIPFETSFNIAHWSEQPQLEADIYVCVEGAGLRYRPGISAGCGACKLGRSCAAAFFVFLAAAAGTWFVPARLRRWPLDRRRGRAHIELGF